MPEWHKLLVPHANLAGADLRNRFFGAGHDLTEADLQKADLSGSHFSEGWLEAEEIHTKHHLADALYGSDFSRANLNFANLSRVNFAGCTFTGATFRGAILDGADLTRAWLYGADFTDASLVGVLLHGTNLTKACLHGAQLRNADFRAYRDPPPEDFTAKYLSVRNISAAVVTGADFRDANVNDALTDGVDFSSCTGIS